MSSSQPYTQEFFDAHEQRSLDSARAVLPELFSILAPASVVDVGCGRGTWLRAAKELGVGTVVGVDGEYTDWDHLAVESQEFVAADLQSDFVATLAARGRTRFDLVLCLEVAEHLPYDAAPMFVQRLASLGDAILFSAAVPFQSGTGHVNEQWPEFWAWHFRRHRYECFDALRPRLWARTDVEWWYAQNMLLFGRAGTPMCSRLSATQVEPTGTLSRIHPLNYLFQILYLHRTHRVAARQEELDDWLALSRTWSTGAAEPPFLAAVDRAREAPPGAVDVFPHTRNEIGSPEAELSRRVRAERRVAELTSENAELRQRLTSANHRSR